MGTPKTHQSYAPEKARWIVSVSRSACLTCVAAGSDDLPWPRSSSMDIDTDKIDEAVLALLYLTLHDGVRAWKGHDWDALDRLYRKGMIENPVGKAKSVVLTDEGLAKSERLFRNLFERSTP
jgi:peptidoglycan/xylan/chitin deacetylase (PgdA/CDA1 family)